MKKKNLLKIVALLLVTVFLSSCSRGGYGCPYEMNIGFDLLNWF